MIAQFAPSMRSSAAIASSSRSALRRSMATVTSAAGPPPSKPCVLLPQLIMKLRADLPGRLLSL